MKKILFVLVVLVSGCTDADWAALGAWGDEAHVVCYSGGVVIYDGYSTGKIAETQSDGYYFMEKSSGRLVEVSGACVITRESKGDG